MNRKRGRIFKTLVSLFIIGIILLGVSSLIKGNKNEIEALNNDFVNSSPYVLEIEVKQNHLSFSLGTYIKDAINAFEFKIPVSKNYFDSVEIGTILADNFRFGSLVTEGTVGSWKITVKNKINQSAENLELNTSTDKVLSLNIRQTHTTVSVKKYLKDSINDIVISIKVDDDYYNSVKKGDVLVNKFRWGSVINDGSFGHWQVVVGEK